VVTRYFSDSEDHPPFLKALVEGAKDPSPSIILRDVGAFLMPSEVTATPPNGNGPRTAGAANLGGFPPAWG
jgi:hypothetical protein